jgi:outer membrane lipoprotein-sorting protein
VETRELTLLAEPETLRGRLTFERPGLLRWEYDEPERRVYVLREGELVGWLPEKNRVEKLDVSRNKKRLERLMALGQGTEELEQDFRIEFVDDTDQIEGADQILLIPKSRRVKRRIQELRLWVSREHGLPRRIRYVTGEADATVTLEMTGFVINPQLGPASFDLEIPPEAEIVEGLSSLGLAPESTTDAR